VTLAYTEELRDRLRALVRDVGPLATVSALGFVDVDVEEIDRALREVERATEWRYLDLRERGVDESREALRGALPEAPVLVVASTAEPPRPLIEAVRAYVDRNAEIDLGDRRRFSRRPDASLLLVCSGVPNLERTDRELRRIPYWDFVP
jgi:hypothetical protein